MVAALVILSIKSLLLANIKAESFLLRRSEKSWQRSSSHYYYKKTIYLAVYLLNIRNNGEQSQLQRSVFEHEPHGREE